MNDSALLPKLSDGLLAIRIAETSATLLCSLRAGRLLPSSPLGSAGDSISQKWIDQVLRQWRPEDGFLSEEGGADESRLAKSRVWVVDPLDGTREYSEGRSDWAVHVALTVDGEPAIGAVALPGLGVTLSTEDKSPLPTAPNGPLRIAVSRTRPPAVAESVAATLGAELVPMGSAGFKAMAVVRGEVHAYLHAGGQYEWDSAAPAAVALSRGLHASRLDGEPLRYNRPDPHLPDVIVCRPELATQLLEAIARVGWSS